MTPRPYDPGAEIMKIRWFFKKEMKPSKLLPRFSAFYTNSKFGKVETI